MRCVCVALCAGGLILMTACGSSSPPPGHALAQAACESSGAQAAQDASQAAAVNSSYSTLSVDEHALAAHEAQQTGELSDGTSSDDSGLGALAGAESMGTGSDIQVLSDCVKLGLHVSQP